MKTRIFLALALLTAVFTAAYGDNNRKQPDSGGWIDPGFAKVLQQKGYIANAKTVTPADVAEIIKVDVDWAELTSLKGIEYFESLQELDCGFNKLTSLDVSRNPKLTMLSCQKNQLTALDVSCNPQLIDLTCFGNKLTALDVSGNPRLMWFNCWDNQLTTLDVSNNPLLMWLNCYGNQLRGLDISNNKQLTDLTCHDNPGADGRFVVEAWFDNSDVPSSITGNTDYKSSWVYKGRTVRIDYTISNRWIDPDFAKVLQQKGYIADADTVTPADVAEITKIDVAESGLTSLRGIEYFVSLQELNCNFNQLTTLDVSRNLQLTTLYCSKNQLTTLDVNNNSQLTVLSCGENPLTRLDVSNNPQLVGLYCDENQLTSLNVSRNPQLKSLWCHDNQLTSLDVSNNPQLTVLYCFKNQLTTLDVNNNSQLTVLSCGENPLTRLDVSNNPQLVGLYCDENQLTSLNVSRNPQLTKLYCRGNQLTRLDVSNNPQLTELGCTGNQLTRLNVSSNPQLTGLYCDKNQLTSLDVRRNPQLRMLDCHYNQLMTLDISNNTQLKLLNTTNNPGANGLFRIDAWFDNSNVPSITGTEYYKSSWIYNGKAVKIDYNAPKGKRTITATDSEQAGNQVFDHVEEMPWFPGGEEAMLQWIASHLRYPTICQENNIQGRVVVQFVVCKDGSVGQVNVVRPLDPELDKEAVRVVKSLPAFIPGKQNGIPANVWYTVPITFKLQRESSDL